jgi:hypothetical protein
LPQEIFTGEYQADYTHHKLNLSNNHKAGILLRFINNVLVTDYSIATN